MAPCVDGWHTDIRGLATTLRTSVKGLPRTSIVHQVMTWHHRGSRFLLWVGRKRGIGEVLRRYVN